MLKKLLNRFFVFYMNASIHIKLLLMFTFMIVVLSAVTGLYQYSVSMSHIEKELELNNQQVVDQISVSIDFLQQDIDELSTFIVLSPELQSMIALSESDTAQFSHEENLIFNDATRYLNNLVASKSYISFISIYGRNGISYYLSSDGSIGIPDYATIKDTSIFECAQALKGKQFWRLLNNDVNRFITKNMRPKVASFRSLQDFNKMSLNGFMMICVNISTIQQICTRSESTSTGLILLDDENNIICSSGNRVFSGEDLDQIIAVYTRGDQDHFYLDGSGSKLHMARAKTGRSAWNVISVMSYDIKQQQRESIWGTAFIVTINCVIVAYMLFFFVSNVFTKPFNKLLASMGRLQEGDFRGRVNFSYRDEVGRLGAGYDAMVDSIQVLINRVYKAQIKEKEAKLKRLQSQINPHFLYNTLDSIFWKARNAGDTEVSEMIYTLSKLFRQILNFGNEFTTVAKEKELVENYLLLQKERYKDKLNYIIQFDENMLEDAIPGLILQPIVENAILHGIIPKNKEGMIMISGACYEGKIVLKVIDNGIGMEEESIAQILSATSEPSEKNQSSGYALKNIMDRLQLYYEDDHSFSVVSSPGHGTTVTISLKRAGLLPSESIEQKNDGSEQE